MGTKKSTSFFTRFIKKQQNRNSATMACDKRSTDMESEFDSGKEAVLEVISDTSYPNDESASEDCRKTVIHTKHM